jgi:hypothetical protein
VSGEGRSKRGGEVGAGWARDAMVGSVDDEVEV